EKRWRATTSRTIGERRRRSGRSCGPSRASWRSSSPCTSGSTDMPAPALALLAQLPNLPRASTYAGDIDHLIELVSWLVGVWFVAAQLMFFWLMWRFRKRPGVPSQYVTGKEKHLKRWINVPHTLILLCDIVIIVGAIRVW